jgi:hypothetical protein
MARTIRATPSPDCVDPSQCAAGKRAVVDRILGLEAARRKDECAVLRKQLGGDQLVYSSASEAQSSSGTDAVQSALLQAFEAPGIRARCTGRRRSVDNLFSRIS